MIEFCTNRLGTIVPSIARAHRLGRFSSDKKGPIIVTFYNDNEVAILLSQGHKLKNTTFIVSLDNSEAVLHVRRKLLQFSKTITKDGGRIHLVLQQTFVNNDTYIWDPATNCAAPVTQTSAWRILVTRPVSSAPISALLSHALIPLLILVFIFCTRI